MIMVRRREEKNSDLEMRGKGFICILQDSVDGGGRRDIDVGGIVGQGDGGDAGIIGVVEVDGGVGKVGDCDNPTIFVVRF